MKRLIVHDDERGIVLPSKSVKYWSIYKRLRSRVLLGVWMILSALRRLSVLRLFVLSLALVVTLWYFGSSSKPGKVLILVRTYVKHDDGNIFTLREFLQKLVEFNNQNWLAVIFTTDPTPFPNLNSIVNSFNDSRFIVDTTTGKRKKYDLFEAAYSLTSIYIAKYGDPEKFQWLLITNGDNWYFPDTLDYLFYSEEIISFNFFSRWNHQLQSKEGEQCWTNIPDAVTDLGANIVNLPKFVNQRWKYSDLPKSNDQDKLMMKLLLNREGWKSKLIPKCLLSHNPNRWSCNLKGGIWFNSPHRFEMGCMTQEESIAKVSSEVDLQKGGDAQGQLIRYIGRTKKRKEREAEEIDDEFTNDNQWEWHHFASNLAIQEINDAVSKEKVLDVSYYIQHYTDTGPDPIHHYIHFGMYEIRKHKWDLYDEKGWCVSKQNYENASKIIGGSITRKEQTVRVELPLSCDKDASPCVFTFGTAFANCMQHNMKFDVTTFCNGDPESETCSPAPLSYAIDRKSTKAYCIGEMCLGL